MQKLADKDEQYRQCKVFNYRTILTILIFSDLHIAQDFVYNQLALQLICSRRGLVIGSTFVEQN
jgi:hypothetical protein